MKKIFLILCSVLLTFGAMAQLPANRTAQTVVADALAQLPAKDQEQYNQMMKDLAATGEEGILILASKLNAPDKGSNAAVEYALSGISHYVGGAGDENLRTTVSNAYVKALKAADVKENKQFIITQLQMVGKDEAVDALAPQLGNPELSDYAARALATIKTEKAGTALKTALLRKMGTVGTQRNVVLTIGEARVGGAEDLLLGLLSTDDEALKKNVLYALSRTGGEASMKALYAAAEKAGFGYDRTNATEAYIALLKNRSSEPENTQSEQAANNLLKTATKAGQNQTRIAALEILLNIQKGDGLKTLQAALKDPCPEYRNTALKAFSPYADENSYTALLKLLPKAKPEVKADIYNQLCSEAQCPDKSKILRSLNPALLKTVIQGIRKDLNSDHFDLKQASAKTLLMIDNDKALPETAQFLASNDAKVVELGKNLLSSAKGNISSAVAEAITTASDKGKIAGVELLAARKSTQNLNSVLTLIRSGSPEVKTAALKALKDVVTADDLETLASMGESADKQDVPYIQQAGIAALSSLPVARQLELMKEGMSRSGNKKYLYYMPLASTGDPQAISLIKEGFASGNKDAENAAFDALLSWNGKDAAELIYGICQNPSASEYFDRALATYVKKVSNPALTGENRLIFLRKAMETAKTDAQKNEILKQIGQTGTYLALLYAGEFLDRPALKENAAQAVMNIALNHREYTGENVVALLNRASAALNNPDADYQRQSIKKHLDEMPKEKGFISLFNGKDLTGWKGLLAAPNDNPLKRALLKPQELAKAQTAADEQMRRDWIVENGLLAYVGHSYNNLCTDRKYGDFEMYVDWMLDPAGPEADAGVYLRGTPQVQIWDISRTNVGAQVGSGGLYNNQTHPSKPLKLADNKLGEWNTLYIKMIGDRVTVQLNGERVVDNVILENYWNRNLPVPDFEQIELQAHGSKVYYRNIYVKELERPKPFELSAQEKKEGFQILFDGTNMHEWTGNLTDYQLEDGCISVHPTQSFGGNLYTKKEYANFAFRFEFQLTPSANNGVGIRAPMEGDNAYNAMEIQILDCEHPVYKDIMPYQHHGSIYGVMAAEHGAMNPTGEWNEEEIYADGDHIRITLNGKVILDGNIREAAKNGTIDRQNHPGLFNKSGHIGFLGHGNELKFKNIRIKELK
jgi:HEAT repeat protein